MAYDYNWTPLLLATILPVAVLVGVFVLIFWCLFFRKPKEERSRVDLPPQLQEIKVKINEKRQQSKERKLSKKNKDASLSSADSAVESNYTSDPNHSQEAGSTYYFTEEEPDGRHALNTSYQEDEQGKSKWERMEVRAKTHTYSK